MQGNIRKHQNEQNSPNTLNDFNTGNRSLDQFQRVQQWVQENT
jgi:hypothetical protein